jgi:hypothetical protein
MSFSGRSKSEQSAVGRVYTGEELMHNAAHDRCAAAVAARVSRRGRDVMMQDAAGALRAP